MPGSINFFTEDISFQLKQKRKIREWICEIADHYQVKFEDLNFIFCSDEYLLTINKKYLKHNYFTDIITFSNGSEKIISGDMFISLDRIKENAISGKVTFNNELHRVMVHGLLHLLGFDDKKANDARRIRREENKMLSLRSFK